MLDCVDLINVSGKYALGFLAGLFKILRDNKDAASTIESAGKVIALIFAGWWTWKAFVRKRTKFPSAKVEHTISHWEDAGIQFLRVTLRMTNTGNVLISVAEGCTWIQRVTPVPQEICDAVAKGEDPVQPATTEFGWTMIGERNLDPARASQIEPGESDELHFDFTIPGDVSRVLIYSYVANSTRGRLWWKTKEIGWQLSTVYEIPSRRRGIREWLIKDLETNKARKSSGLQNGAQWSDQSHFRRGSRLNMRG